MPLAPNPIDLCTVQQVQSWLVANQQNTSDNDNIQLCITAASNYWLWRTGRGNADGSMPSESPLVQQVSYTETYDGLGGFRQPLRITPIVSVSSLAVWRTAIPASPDGISPGFVIDTSRKALSIVGQPIQAFGFRGPYGVFANPFGGVSPTFGGGFRFYEGNQNVFVTYTAGFAQTPFDIEQAAIEMVGTNLNRRKWNDTKSQSMAQGAGTISFRDWLFNPLVLGTLENYTRRAPVY